MSDYVAKRFAGKPLRQPPYSFRDVPRCERDLSKSTLQEVKERDHFTDAIAEMVLLCNEATRRQNVRQNSKQSSKPLSLEYIADRIDVDDPIFGYFVRTASPPEDKNRFHDPNNSAAKWKEGMLQGFAVVTTFTNWQRTFRWDSMHEAATSYDDDKLSEQIVSGERLYDQDGSLSEALEATVRCGDPWNEGIVWPRIAEVSLLGGLGCGRALLPLVIEKLEHSAPSNSQNYEYLVLQATDNSVPFYESMGFIRVGCISEDENFEKKEKEEKKISSDDDDASVDSNTPVAQVVVKEETETVTKAEVVKAENNDKATAKEAKGSSKGDTDEPKSEIVSSALDIYVTKKAWEWLPDIAKQLKVSMWDILFLNQYTVPGISKGCRLKRNTSLFYPSERAKYDAISNVRRNKKGKSSATQWFFARENDTPKQLAKRFKVKCRDLVDANIGGLPDLQSSSRLMEGTKLQVSNFDAKTDKYFPYCHWTFPDDTVETSEPSYMMAKKLNRSKSKLRPIEASFAVPVTKYALPKIFSAPIKTPKKSVVSTAKISSKKKSSKKRKLHPDEPIAPKRPMPSYFFYIAEMRAEMKEEFGGKPMAECNKLLSQQWSKLPPADKVKYEEMSDKSKADYKAAMAKYKIDLEAFRKDHPDLASEESNQPTILSFCNGDSEQKLKKDGKTKHLFNKVVVLSGEGLEEAGTEYKYFYVLTYIPDLQWCHLAPMRKVGTYGPENRKAMGRPIWMLEEEGSEVDVSASFCEVVKSRSTRGVEDADKEQWDIPDSGPSPPMINFKEEKKEDDQKKSAIIGGTASAFPAAVPMDVPIAVPVVAHASNYSTEYISESPKMIHAKTSNSEKSAAGLLSKKSKLQNDPKQQLLAFPILSSQFSVATTNKRLKISNERNIQESKGSVVEAKKPDTIMSDPEEANNEPCVELSTTKPPAFFDSSLQVESNIPSATPFIIAARQKGEGD
mmetsp:Transcript_15145/g.22244  ORF Transcript_15145/g.22244 Transcript_15145/m.22244 type:complete len:961 (+) Transcript_15145:292-3174(+)